MAWMRDGSVAVTQGQATITGTGTGWSAATVRAGHMFQGPDRVAYEVQSLSSETSLTLATPYQGASGSGLSYAVIPSQGETVALNDAVTELIADIRARVDPLDVAEAARAQTLADALDRHEVDFGAALAGYQNQVDAANAQIDLAAIAASKAVTAVDVFVYDTSLDSDGGAWRHRCTGTSWYSETLNTATRGSRREFPAVAVIVAETDKVTIYDGDDPSLPMWMVFTGQVSHSIFLRYASSGGISVFMVNAHFCFGTTGITTSGSINAVGVANFVADSLGKWDEIGYFKSHQGVVDRNDNAWGDSLGWWNPPKDASKKIVNQYVNDVAMTVLPDAPIDPATGLPVPTIAVATAGGLSILKDNGTVVDSGATAGVNRVQFADTSVVWVPGSTPQGWWITDNVGLLADGFSYTEILRREDTSTGNYPKAIQASGVNLRYGFLGDNVFAMANYTSSTPYSNGFYLYQRGEAVTVSQNKGMIAKVQSTYNTGWMNGDIKGAFLSDTDDTDLVAGSLTTDTYSLPTGWAFSAGVLSYDGSGPQYGQPLNTLSEPVVPGRAYRAKFTVSGIAAGEHMNIKTPGFTTAQNTFAADGTYEVYLVAATVAGTIGFQNNFASQTFTVTDVSLDIADADRSVNNKGLIVNGTVTRTPVATGAELVAYSGFSASNYLEQAILSINDTPEIRETFAGLHMEEVRLTYTAGLGDGKAARELLISTTPDGSRLL